MSSHFCASILEYALKSMGGIWLESMTCQEDMAYRCNHEMAPVFNDMP